MIYKLSVSLDRNATTDMWEHSSPIEYSITFLAIFPRIITREITSVQPSVSHAASNKRPATAE